MKHLTIIEDAQYFAPRDKASQTKITSYLEDIALLQRGTGECLITIATRPNVSPEILANCGVLITFKTYMQKDFLCKLLNLKEEQEDILSSLGEGQCIVRVNSIDKPFLISVPYVKRHWLKRGDVNRKNKEILKKLEEKKKLETPQKYYCKFCGKEVNPNEEECEECSTKLEKEDKEHLELEKFIDTLLDKQKKS